MKKFIALFLSVLVMFGSLSLVASAAGAAGYGYGYGKDACTPCTPCTPVPQPTTKPEPTTKKNVVVNNNINNITNVTNNNITVMPEEDPTTVFGFLYRVIKTIVPYLYKILSLFSVDISFGGNNSACNNCGSTNGCDCDVNNKDYVIVDPGGSTGNGGNGGNGGNIGNTGSNDSDSSDSDSDSDSLLGSLFGDLFA